MTPEQFAQLMALLSKLADRQYAITSASDWPILLVVGGLLITAIGIMWVDLKTTIKEGKEEWRDELKVTKEDLKKADDKLWEAMRDCKDDCCPGLRKEPR